MNRKEYITALRAQLRRLPSDDVEEIVKEFETHFEMGLADGKSESEIAAKLGSPEEVSQIYLSDAIPAFDVSGAQNVCAPQMPIIPVKTGMVIDRGVGPQTAAGFAAGGFARPLVNAAPRNTAPKPEPPSFENAHTGAKDKETYEEPQPQTGKKYDLPDYTQYPSQDPNTVKKAGKEHNLLFSVLSGGNGASVRRTLYLGDGNDFCRSRYGMSGDQSGIRRHCYALRGVLRCQGLHSGYVSLHPLHH